MGTRHVPRRSAAAATVCLMLAGLFHAPAALSAASAQPNSDPVPPATGFTELSSRQASLGVEHLRLRREEPLAEVHVARVRPDVARTRLRLVAAGDSVSGKREAVSSICERSDCAVALNGDYWDDSGRPVGPVVIDGELYQSPPDLYSQVVLDLAGTPSSEALNWSVSLQLDGGQSIPIDAVNRLPGETELSLFTARRGPSTRTPEGTREMVLAAGGSLTNGSIGFQILDQRSSGNLAIEPNRMILAAGTGAGPILDELATQAALGNSRGVIQVSVGAARYAVGGAPRLITGGLYDFPYQVGQGRAPRSAVGWTASGEMLLVAVDGRQPDHSEGLTYTELAQLLAQLGAIEGVALDGGGSTTFVVESSVQNRPSDAGGPRAVANALVVGPAPIRASRVSGADRFATSVAASQLAFPFGANTVIVASGENFPDALAGASAVVARQSPVLLVGRDHLPAGVRAEIGRLGVQGIVLLGGPAAISPAVEAQLRAMVPFTIRFAGADRIGTAVEISKLAFPGGAPVAYLATADAFPDALSAAAGSSLENGPVLLVRGDGLGSAVSAELRRLAPRRIVVVGGTAAVSEALVAEASGIAPVTRHSGSDRYETAATLAASLHTQAGDVVVATGADFPDALTGAWLAGVQRRPLLLVPGGCTPEPVLDLADAIGASGVQIMGGTRAVGRDVERLAVCTR